MTGHDRPRSPRHGQHPKDEHLLVPPALIEQQLAHVVRDPLGRAYNRMTHLPARRILMQLWADALDHLQSVDSRIRSMEGTTTTASPKSKIAPVNTKKLLEKSRSFNGMDET